MRRSLTAAVLASALTAGCGANGGGHGGGGLTYLPPLNLPPADRAVFVPAPPDLVLDQLVDRLPQAGLTVAQVERERGLVVARYSGNPEPYVNCGLIVSPANGSADGRPQEQLAARQRASFERPFGGDPALYERGLRLDGRVVVSVAPVARGSLVDATANYVLTKSVDVVGPQGGGLLAQNREVVSFSTGGGAEFDAGTVCQPTGRLERLALEELTPPTAVATAAPTTSGPLAPPPPPELAARVRDVIAAFACPDIEVTFGAGNAVLLSGYVADPFSQAELPRQLQRLPGIGPVEAQLGVQRPAFCEALEITRSLRGDGSGGPERLDLRVVARDGANTLREGEPLVLDLTVPSPASYLVIDRIEPDGRVTHLAAGSAAELGAPPGATSFRYATGRRAEPPFGRALILAVAAPRPLFDAPRPTVEPADAYLEELHRRLQEVRTVGEPLAATAAVSTTRAGAAS